MESVREAHQRLQEASSTGYSGVKNWLQHSIQNSADTLRIYVSRYPPLAAFLFTLLICSAIPITIFMIYGSVTAVAFFSVAMIGFSFVEGLALLGGGGILLLTLSVILFFTSIGFLWMSAAYLGYKGVCGVWRHLPSASSVANLPVVGSIAQGVQSMQQQQPSYFSGQGTSSGPGTSTGSFFNPSS